MKSIPFELTESQLLVTISLATKDYIRTTVNDLHKSPVKWQSGPSNLPSSRNRNFQSNCNKSGDMQGRHRSGMTAQVLNAKAQEDMVAALKALGNASSICTMCDQTRVPKEYRHTMGECTTFANHVLAGDMAKNNPEMAKEVLDRYSNFIRPPRRRQNESSGQPQRRFNQHQQAHAVVEDGIDEGNGGDDNAQNGPQMAEGSNGVTFSDHVDDIISGINAFGLTGTWEGDDDESYYSSSSPQKEGRLSAVRSQSRA